MTTHPRTSSPAASADHRDAYRRLALAVARGEALDEVARIGLAGARTASGWPAGQLRAVEPGGGRPRLTATLAVVGTDARPDLAPAFTGALPEPGSPTATAAATGRPAWTPRDAAPGAPGSARLAVPLVHGEVLGLIELVDDRPHDVDPATLAALAETAEVLGAVLGRDRDDPERRAHPELDRRLQSQITRRIAEGVSLVGADGTILYVNPQLAAMFGYDAAEMEGRCIYDFNVPEQRPPTGTVTQPRPVELHGELRHVRRDGTIFTTDARATAIPVDGIDGIDGEPGELAWLTVERDVTEEKLQSEALRDSEDRLALIQRHAPIGLALVDLDGRFVQTNPALCAITGRSDDELRTLTIRDVTHPDDRPSSDRGLDRLVRGRISLFETEKRFVRPDGRAVWIAVTSAIARDEEGAPRHIIAQVMDIGARKRAEGARAEQAEELERSNAELRRATDRAERAQRAAVEANRAKNQFLSRMSHELRTPLNAVLGFAQLLGMEDLADNQLDMVDQVLRAGRHLLLLIDEVLDIARLEDGTMTVVVEPVDLPAAVDHARSLLGPLVRERGVNVGRPEPADDHLPPAGADRQRVVQILLNLLSNAVKYNRPGGEVTVTVDEGADRLSITVADTGPGIAPEVLPRVFEPFDRLGAEQTDVEGTGIGLTVSRALAEQMGGRLTVRSTLGEGSTFVLELPLFAATPAAPPA
jgi:PAS domain S-box-containing protein